MPMKKLLFFILFFGMYFGFSGTMNAQNTREHITQQKNDDGVLVAYPNPTKDNLIIKVKDSSLKIKSVTFYSILGTQVANYSINNNSTEINIARFRPGKYLMKYTLSDNTQKIKQIIKQ